MGKPPEGGGSPLTITWCIFALFAARVGAQAPQDYGCPLQEKILPCRCSTRGMEFQIWCSHSELPSVLQGLKAVSHYVTRPVDELILENNNLPSLPGNVFTSLRVLRLMLRNNRLERVSSSWLGGLHDSLLELFIVEPELRSLPVDSLENLQGLEAVTLQSKSMKRLPRFTGLSKLRYLQVNSPSLLELSPTNFRDLPNLEQLHVFGSPRLSRLEAGLFRNLPRLSLLNVTGSAISWIHPRSLIDVPELKEISLTDNEISDASIVGRAIVDLPSLSVLNLDGNRIPRLPESSFVDNSALNRLSLARNAITDISAGAFQRLANLRVLDLSHNRVRHVSPEFFLQRTGSRLEEIWLIDNDIRHFTELRSILEALPALKILDISHNLLEAIPYGALRGHPTLERLHLDHNRLSFLQRDSFVAMPALRELRLRNNSLNDLLDTPFWNLPGLKGLDLSENYFRRLSPRLLANLPNLRRLDISGNGIVVVEPETFLGCVALEHINISGNALSTIHPLTFRHLTNLYELDVGWNRLLEIVPGLPRNIEHLHLPMNRIVEFPSLESQDLALGALRSLDVSANGIETIQPGSLADLVNLRKLNLGYNSLRLVEDGTFDGLTRLEKLDLRYNRLVSLHGRSLKPLRNLMDLDLRGNRLEIIRPDVFRDNSQLQRLDISHNHLAQIPNPTFSTTKGLRELHASHNALTELPASLHGLKSLEVLDLSFNKLNILSPETLSSLTSLLELRLVRNRIKELREGAFKRLPRLSFIDLESNDLRVVERNAIRSLPELQSLRLGKNHLKSIPSGAFSELPLLQSAELQENQINEIAPDAFVNVPHLLFLNLSHNQLPELSYVGLDSLRSLEVLDLSHNHLSGISGDSLAAMEWLVELKMDNNRICSIQGSPFDDMPRLRVLSLRSNRMTSVAEKAFKRLRSNIAILDIDGNPLSCSCGMLWLRGWLQQASAEGPRCADGSLFREIRLSRQDCQRSSQIEPTYPGCDVETIDQSESHSTAHFEPGSPGSPEWMNLRDPERDHQASQNLDYPQYEDYASETNANTLETSSVTSSSSVVGTTTISLPSVSPSESVPASSPSFPTSSSSFSSSSSSFSSSSSSPTTQKVPTASKNPIASPSSSGFTFFGVPLPNINFNLWGNSRSRKAQRKEGVPRLANGNHNRPGRGRYRVYPPTEPEIHRGGFFPLPQGQGGFVPIPDPRLVSRGSASDNGTRTATVTRVFQIPRMKNKNDKSSRGEEKPRTSSGGKLPTKERDEVTTVRYDAESSQRMPSGVPKPTVGVREAEEYRRRNEKVSPVNENRSGFPNGGHFLPTVRTSLPTVRTLLPTVHSHVSTERVYLSTDYQNLPTETSSLSAESSSVPIEMSSLPIEVSSLSADIGENDDHSLEPEGTEIDDGPGNKVVWTSPSSLEISKGENSSNDETTTVKETTTMKKISIWDVESRLPPGKHVSAEDVDNEDYETDYRSSQVSKTSVKIEKSSVTSQDGEISEASALSALLVPGGQVLTSSPSKPPTGRSTIVKVASPHLSLTADEEPSEDSLNFNNTDSTSEDPSLEESVKTMEENPFNWYFQNYNESEIEPYVAVVYSGVSSPSIPKFLILLLLPLTIHHRLD